MNSSRLQIDKLLHKQIASNASAKFIIQGADLKTKFMNLNDSDKFIIAEIGFQTGVNFILISHLWQKYAPKKAKLVFISFENKPMPPKHLQQLIVNAPKYLSNLYRKLINQYYLILDSTTHPIQVAQNIFLNLVTGEIKPNITKQQFSADIWLINQISNIALEDQLIDQIRQKSQLNTILIANYNYLQISNLLKTSGFRILNHNLLNNCFSAKLEVITPTQVNKSRLSSNKPKPWFDCYHNQNTERKTIIIGGGISGATTAHALAKRGHMVTIYESKPKLAMGASSILQGMLYGNFSGNNTPILELSKAGYRYSHYLIRSILKANLDYSSCGLIQLAYNSRQWEKQLQILSSNYPAEFCYEINQDIIKKLSGIEANCKSGLYFPYGLWINIPQFVKKLSKHNKIQVKCNNLITQIAFINNHWHIFDENNNVIDYAPNLVLCNSYAVEQFLPKLNIRKIRGQVSRINSQNNLKTILCGEGYITPNSGKHFTIGATFKFNDLSDQIKSSEHQENLNSIQEILTSYIDKPINEVNLSGIQGQVGIRASTPDYMPLVGPIADYPQFIQTFQDLKKDSNYWIDKQCPYLNGLFLNVAHGSKGILTAPISSEVIASYIDNDIMPVGENVRIALHPNRIWLKQIIKSGTNKFTSNN